MHQFGPCTCVRRAPCRRPDEVQQLHKMHQTGRLSSLYGKRNAPIRPVHLRSARSVDGSAAGAAGAAQRLRPAASRPLRGVVRGGGRARCQPQENPAAGFPRRGLSGLRKLPMVPASTTATDRPRLARCPKGTLTAASHRPPASRANPPVSDGTKRGGDRDPLKHRRGGSDP